MGSTLVIRAVARLVLVPSFVLAAAILAKGYSQVGDGFAAGVVAALGLLLQYSAFGYREAERRLPVRLLPAAAYVGLLLLIGLAFVPTIAGEPLVTHFPRPGEEVVRLGVLELATVVLFDVAIFFVVVGAVTGVVGRLARTREEGGA